MKKIIIIMVSILAIAGCSKKKLNLVIETPNGEITNNETNKTHENEKIITYQMIKDFLRDGNYIGDSNSAVGVINAGSTVYNSTFKIESGNISEEMDTQTFDQTTHASLSFELGSDLVDQRSFVNEVLSFAGCTQEPQLIVSKDNKQQVILECKQFNVAEAEEYVHQIITANITLNETQTTIKDASFNYQKIQTTTKLNEDDLKAYLQNNQVDNISNTQFNLLTFLTETYQKEESLKGNVETTQLKLSK